MELTEHPAKVQLLRLGAGTRVYLVGNELCNTGVCTSGVMSIATQHGWKPVL
jgi:hypothetical protein